VVLFIGALCGREFKETAGRGTRQHAGAGILIRDGNGHDDHLLP
jgi:hypothetical protein